MSQPLSQAPRAVPTQPAPAKPKPRVAFDPLDAQWQPGAQDASRDAVQHMPQAAAGTASTLRKPTAKAAPLDVEAARKREQADAIVVLARRAFVRGDLSGAREQVKQAFAIDAANPAALELLGDTFLSEAEQEKAIRVFKRGAELHPERGVFEEKIGLALLDIDEEKRDRDIAALLLENPESLRWAERKPVLAASLSLLAPGAGQFYNDEPERGAVLLGSAVVLFGGWYWIFDSATSSVSGRQLIGRTGSTLAQMSGLAKFGFWVLLLAWLAMVSYAVVDAYQGARNANRAHRPFEV